MSRIVWTSIGCFLLLNLASAQNPEASRGYTIPVIDISAEMDRVVTVDREPKQFLGPTTTALLDDGKTIVAIYPKGTSAGPLVLKRSFDAGKTWGLRQAPPKNWLTSKDPPVLHQLTDANGKKRLMLFSGQYPIRRSISEDGGKTWTDLTAIGEYGGILPMSSVIPLSTGPGHYIGFFHDDGRFFKLPPKKTPEYTVYKTTTLDGGMTWTTPEPIAKHRYAWLSEPCAIRSPDGKRIAVILRESRRVLEPLDPNEPKQLFNSFVIFSDDDGKTWTAPRELPGAITGDRHIAKYAPDGRLVVVFRDMAHESKSRGDWVAWVGRYEDIVNGTEGQYRVRLRANFVGATKKLGDCGYSGLELLPDGTFVATSYGHWAPITPAYIVSLRFSLSELDKLRK